MEFEVLPLSEALSSKSPSSMILSRGVVGTDALRFIFGFGTDSEEPIRFTDCDSFFLPCAAGFLRCETVRLTEPFFMRGCAFEAPPCAVRHAASSVGVWRAPDANAMYPATVPCELKISTDSLEESACSSILVAIAVGGMMGSDGEEGPPPAAGGGCGVGNWGASAASCAK